MNLVSEHEATLRDLHAKIGELTADRRGCRVGLVVGKQAGGLSSALYPPNRTEE